MDVLLCFGAGAALGLLWGCFGLLWEALGPVDVGAQSRLNVHRRHRFSGAALGLLWAALELRFRKLELRFRNSLYAIVRLPSGAMGGFQYLQGGS